MLRWRLLIGLVSIFILLAAVGGYSIQLILHLGDSIESVLTQNYASIRHTLRIRNSTLRMNARYMKPRVEDMPSVEANALDGDFEPDIRNSLQFLAEHATGQDEAAATARLNSTVEAYLALFSELLRIEPGQQMQFEDIREKLVELNLALTKATEDVLLLNEAKMMAANARAHQVATDTVLFIVATVAIAMAVLLYTYYRMGKSIVLPIEELTRSIEEVRRRNFGHTISFHSTDELGRLGRAFNAMAVELRAFYHETDETIMRLNRSIRETIAAFPYPVILLDAAGEIWATNAPAQDFLESASHGDEVPAAIRKHLEQVHATGRDYLPENLQQSIFFRIHEKEVHFLPRILRIFSPDGVSGGTAIILIDVSRFRWLDDMKTSLISTISHEIKTPLTGIRMILHLLLEKKCGDLTEIQDEMVRSASDDCERLLGTLNGLLELSRMEAGRTELTLTGVPPRDLLEDCTEAIREQAAHSAIALEIDAPDDLPHVSVDRGRVGHVFSNFASNALKFAPRNSTIRFVAKKMGADFVRMSVIDSGPGVPEEYQSRIFEKFFRPPGQHTEGVGLGLSIAREIVSAHDGRIGMHSIPHRETEFYCDLLIA